MVVWRIYLLLVVTNLACITALPTRSDAEKEPVDTDQNLLFESHDNAVADDQNRGSQSEGVPANPEVQEPVKDEQNEALYQKAIDMNIGRKAPEGEDDIGVLSGHDRAHGDEQHVHENEEEMLPMKHVNTGALDDDFVHNMMHDDDDDDGDHEAEDEVLLRNRPAEIKDVAKMDFSQEDLKEFKKDAFNDPDEGQPTYDDQEHGPKRPDQGLHGVLMHGDTSGGNSHEHDHEVMQKQDGNDGVAPEAPNTVDVEKLVHGDGAEHVHGQQARRIKEDNSPDAVLGDNFMHNLMHGGLEKHQHDDSELKRSKVIRPRDLVNLGLDENMLKGLDLKKMIQEDMEEYNRYMSEKGGDEDSVWNILNSFKFRYFKNNMDIDDISSREPKNEEWDEAVVSRHAGKTGNAKPDKHVQETQQKNTKHKTL